MKITLQFIAMMLITTASLAQSTVNIQINHLLDGVQYENEVNAANDLGNAFMIDRLQYYISGFSITHDGGQITNVNQLFTLVSLLESSEPTFIELGDLEFENLESINFHFGINQNTNHADPSQWPVGHPLAPQFPSMHWGWAAGYRFIALEGKSGPNVNQDLQFHCIGDEFYQELQFPVEMSGEDTYILTLDAEYTKLLEGIDVSSGLIIHGGTGEVQILAANISEKVFTAASVTSTNDSDLVNLFEVYPNPVTNGTLNINLDLETTGNIIRVNDVMGRVISINRQNESVINLPNTGMYFISVINESGQTLATRKVIVQR